MFSKLFCSRLKLIQAANVRAVPARFTCSAGKSRFCSSQLHNSYLNDDCLHSSSTSISSSNTSNYSLFNTSNYSSSDSSSDSSSNLSNFQISSSRKSFLLNSSIKLIAYGVVAFVIYELSQNRSLYAVHAKQLNPELNQDELAKQYGKFDKRFRTVTIDELNKHNCKENRIWVAFREGVYDITDFVDQHPGGKIIEMGAGNRIDSFWAIYANHKTKQVLELLETYRIANIEFEEDTITADGESDPFSNDPIRNPMLKVHTKKPFNAETPSLLIGKDFLTPNEVFFVRNHLPVPEIDPKDYRLEITGFGLNRTYEFTLDDLKKLPKHDVIATIQCAGNRREEFKKYGEVKGLSWQKGAIANAKWTGVYLVDLLKSINCDMNNKNIKHVVCEGHDFDPTSKPYSASVQSELALDPNNHILIAYAMNDQDIPRDHGYPVRFIAPGVVGARNVKWLAKITLSSEEANSHVQRSDYKSFTPDVTMSNVDFSKGYSIQKLPVQSAIVDPDNNAKIPIKQVLDNQGKIKLSGYAYSSTSRIIRVDVSKRAVRKSDVSPYSLFKRDHRSSDEQNELVWIGARLFGEEEFKKKVELDDRLRKGQITVDEHRALCGELPTDLMRQDTFKSYSWVLWSVELQIDENELKKGNKIEFICKAIDSSYNTQPEDAKSLFNFRGVLNNAWHRIQVEFV